MPTPQDEPLDQGPASDLADWLTVIDGLHEAVVAADTTGRILYANAALESLLGWDRDQLRGRPLRTLIPERFHERHLQGFSRFTETGEGTVLGRPLRVPALRSDGTERHVELVLSASRIRDELLVLGLLRDVSQRIELEGPGELPDLLVATLAEAATLDEALPRVLASLGEVLSWKIVQLWMVDDDVLRCRCSWSRDPDTAGVFERSHHGEFRRGVGLPGRVWQAAAPAWIVDVAADNNLPRAAEAAAAGLRAGLAVPVLSGHRLLGVIELFSDEPRSPSPELVDRLTRLGQELGQFIERRTSEEQRLALLQSEQAAKAEAEAARRRLTFLSEASSVLAESLDVDVTLERVASLAVPTLGDWCVIHLLDGDTVHLGAVAHADASMVELLRYAHTRYPTDLSAPGGVGAVIRTGELVHHDAVSDDVLATVARDEHHLDLLRRLAFGSVLTVPLIARDRRLGALSIASRAGARLEDTAVATAVDLARRAAVAIDNARLHRDLLEAHEARRFQAALLETQSEAGVEGQLVVSAEGEMISFNRRFAEMWNLPDDVLERRLDQEAIAASIEHVEDPEGFVARVQEIYENPRPSREQIRLRDGRVFDRYGAPLQADGVYLGYAWYFHDVSEQKQAEAKLREAGGRFATLARTLQRSLLPPTLPAIRGVDVGARYHPAGEGDDVGGDFYDVFRLGRTTWGIVIGDVCGKGPEAAATTALARYTIRAAAMQSRSPARALTTLNEAMLRDAADGGSDRFATVVHARIRPRRGSVHIELAVGGHPLPLLRRADGRVEVVGRPGTLLGVTPDVTVSDVQIELLPDDTLVLVTDGVLEARRGVEQFGEQRLRRLLEDEPPDTAERLAKDIEHAALEHQGGPAGDDMAVLVLKALATRSAPRP